MYHKNNKHGFSLNNKNNSPITESQISGPTTTFVSVTNYLLLLSNLGYISLLVLLDLKISI